jgi:hypothetical protein
MTKALSYVAARPGDIYWRYEVCPYKGADVLLRTIGGVLVRGHWYGKLGEAFVAWCPMPKDGEPPAAIAHASLRERLRFAFNLIFNPKGLS